jgi:hypothetical protein
VTSQAGIDVPNHSGRPGLKEALIEAVGPGAAWLDYDGDGFIDLYVPDGDVFPNYELVRRSGPEKPRVTRPLLRKRADPVAVYRDQLWRNNGDGTFTDVARQAGIDETRWSFGATPFDYDADGDTDIFVANFGPDVLWLNNGDGTFTDIAEKVGLAGDPGRWSTCAAVADVDGDDRLDLYVAAYSDPAAEMDRLRVKQGLAIGVEVEAISGRDCTWRGIPAYCGPIGLAGQHDILFRQRDDGTFEDVTLEMGLRPREALFAFTSVAFDFNEDGLIDIYVANDSVPNTMWQQDRTAAGRIRFREVADPLGIKYGRQLTAQASMGVSIADVDLDGLFDIFLTNFSHDYNNLYMARLVQGGDGARYYRDKGLPTMGQQVYYDLSWGCGWYDFDNDGDRDLFVANGHVYKEIDLFEKTGAVYDQPNSLFECMDAARLGFREVGLKAQRNAGPETKIEKLHAGNGMEVEACSRQAAFGDFDNDGRMDVVVLNMNTPPTVLRNASGARGPASWIKLSLRQRGGNREALGAVIEVRGAGPVRRIPVIRQISFLGCDDPRVHVGLGGARRCTIRVIWPGAERATTTFEDLEAGGHYLLDRGSGRATRIELPSSR